VVQLADTRLQRSFTIVSPGLKYENSAHGAVCVQILKSAPALKPSGKGKRRPQMPKKGNPWKPVDFYKEFSPYPLKCYGSPNDVHEKFMNKAFEVHWTARTNIKTHPDAGRRDAMLKQLRECADSGGWDFPPMEPTSLNQAFECVAKYSTWTCPYVGSYLSKDYPYWAGTDVDPKACVNNLPKAAASFFKAFDAKLEEGEEGHKTLWEQLKNLAEIAEYACRTKPTKEQARKAEEAMKTIREAHEKAERFVWWTTKVVDVSDSLIEACRTEMPRLSKLLETVEKCNKGVEKLTDALSKGFSIVETAETVGEIQDRYQSMQGALGPGAAATIALLPEVLGYVPFFGEVYKEAFKVVPGMVSMLENRNAQLQLAMAVGSR
jgi:hypothetical protein